MKTRRELKNEAKAIIKGRWSEMIALHAAPIALAIFTAGSFAMEYFQTPFFLTQETDETISTIQWEWGSFFVQISIYAILGIIITLVTSGISWTLLDLLRGETNEINPLNDNLRSFKMGGAGVVILIAIFSQIFLSLWYLLFIIPFIIKSFSYSQAYLAYYDSKKRGKDLTALQSITASREIMDGHKMDLFILQLSFIGWDILGFMTFGIGYIWITPYKTATTVAFYNDVQKDNTAL